MILFIEYFFISVFEFSTEKALIALECYNNVLRERRTAKTIIHNYRLIELFAMYKDKELPKIKPL